MILAKKRFFLFLLIILEVVGGFFLLYKYRQHTLNKQKVLTEQKIVKIDKSFVSENIDKELRFYWEYNPNDQIKDDADWLEEEVFYSINSDGFNETKDYSVEKPSDTFRIIILGDSFTFGDYVDTQFNWTEVLERRLNNRDQCEHENIEVINLGMPGFDVQYLVNRYKVKGSKYDPDMVIFFESGTGFTRFNEIIVPRAKKCQEDNPEIDDYINCLHEIEDDFIFEYGFDQRLEMLITYFEDLFSYVNQDDVLFFYYDTYYNTYTNIEKDNMEQSKAIDYFENQFPKAKYLPNIPYQKINSDYKFSDGHPNRKGHEQIAEFIYNYLIDDQSLCESH